MLDDDDELLALLVLADAALSLSRGLIAEPAQLLATLTVPIAPSPLLWCSSYTIKQCDLSPKKGAGSELEPQIMHLHIHLSLYKQGTLSAVPQLHTPRMLMGMDYGPSISQLPSSLIFIQRARLISWTATGHTLETS